MLYRFKTLLLAVSFITLSACGGGGGGSSDDGGGGSSGGGSGGNDSPSTTVKDVLDKLNVSTASTPRVDQQGDALPDTYAPLGTKTSANRFAEIVLLGVPVDDAAVSTSNSELVITNLVPQAANRYSWELLHEKPTTQTPWTDPGAKRSSAMADFDGDGLDEIAVVYQVDGDVELVFIDDADENYALSTPVQVDNATTNEIFTAAADFDGDTDIDLVVGLVSTLGDAELKLISNDANAFRFNGVQVSVPKRTLPIGELVLKAANLDHDAALELALAVNAGSIESSQNRIAETESWYSVLDDATTGLEVLQDSESLLFETDRGTVRVAITNLDVGDVDGDNLDEIVLGGLNQSGNLGDGYGNFRYAIEVLDDAKANFASRLRGADTILTGNDGNYQPSSSGANQNLNHVPVVVADIDGDGSSEMLIGQHLYQSLTASPSTLAYYDDGTPATDDDGRAKVPAAEWFGNARSGMQFNFSWNRYSVAVGDVTQDGRENIVLYTQRVASIRGETQALQVWGHDQINGWTKVMNYANQRSNNPYNPQILIPDIELDDGSAMLSYSTGSHQLIFSEPLVIAAIAAAPCSRDLGQDLTESCRSAYGTALSSGGSTTNGSSLTGRASVGLGLGNPLTADSVEITGALERRTRDWTTTEYTLTKSLVYETGAIEDTVVFSSIPMDVYTYTVLSHSNPTLVGQTIDVRLPREPITAMVTREKFNASVLDDSLKIDDSVFQHTEGDISSYPSRAQKGVLLNRYKGIEGTTASVGEGLGQTISTISSFDRTTTGDSYETTKSLNFRGTNGTGGYIITELSVGFGSDNATEISHGTESIFQGSVGNITSDDFDAGRGYNWGLFSYIYEQGEQQPFEVINYWVELQ